MIEYPDTIDDLFMLCSRWALFSSFIFRHRAHFRLAWLFVSCQTSCLMTNINQRNAAHTRYENLSLSLSLSRSSLSPIVNLFDKQLLISVRFWWVTFMCRCLQKFPVAFLKCEVYIAATHCAAVVKSPEHTNANLSLMKFLKCLISCATEQVWSVIFTGCMG